jgi:hypothetical protein
MRRTAFPSLLPIFLVVLALVFALVGCQNLNGTGTTATSSAQGPGPTPPPGPGPGPTPGGPHPEVTPSSGPSTGNTTPTAKKTTTTAASNPGLTMVVAIPVVPAATRYQETNPLLAWTGSWTTGTSAPNKYSGGSERETADAGASVTVKFSGTSISFISAKNCYGGMAKVTLDGGGPILVNFYSADWVDQQTVWQSGNLANGSHTVKMECMGTVGDPFGADMCIYMDAFDITGALE